MLARQRPDVVILELGGNDGLRGYPIGQIHGNLNEMVNIIRATGAEVLLVSIPLPPNYGPRYVRAFQGAFEAVAAAEGVRLLPFTRSLLPLNEDMMQADGIHPTAKAQPLMLDALWPALAPYWGRARGTASPGKPERLLHFTKKDFVLCLTPFSKPFRGDTKGSLILSGLELFATQGLDAVSMRTINAHAGARNASAVHYHFGSKMGMVKAIVEFLKGQPRRAPPSYGEQP